MKEIKILRKLTHKIFYLIACLFVFSSCQHDEVYFRYHELKDAKWSNSDTLVFEIDSTLIEANISYNISLEITNNSTYAYQNLWLFMSDNIESDSTFAKSLHEFTLADEMGKWQGSGFSSLYQSSFIYGNRITFPEKRNICIKVVHGMRNEPLIGIEKVGVSLSRAQ